MILLYAADPAEFSAYRDHVEAGLDARGITAQLVQEAPPETVDFILYAPSSPLQDFRPYTRCKAVLSLWAGVERIVGNATLTQPLARMVDPALTQGMVEYVTAHVLRYHLGLDAHLQPGAAVWQPKAPPLSRERVVGFLGMGTLAQACAAQLGALGFQLMGWSSQSKDLAGITCHSGAHGLTEILGRAEILVCLLPHTPETDTLLDAARFAQMRPGVRLINPGRGTLIDEAALLAALDSGQVAHATLDVFREEPLPQAHPFWTHARITVTPHIAAATRAVSAASVVVENIARVESGRPLLYEVDRARGY